MKSVEHLLEFIKDKLSREEQIYLAAQIQIEIYKNQITSPSNMVASSVTASPVTQQSLVAPVGVVEATAVQTVQASPTEHVSLFTSMDGKDIQYQFLRRKVLTSRPKSLDKVRNFIITTCNGYGGLKSSDLDIALNQLIADNLFKQEDDGTLIWNSN
ncbi:hypothetical protein HCY52_08255 [Acinetobacter radioresistens]|uniref:hypothetical protein n=1 Tax=Acinetobacter radioresistens TaxID=40216 RepID=UPI0020029A86|nr:hypothetical protein [Acinetobacter radioresistens]MCK4083807.1 hypothetical protein [Acinetobacter radioresistens]